MLQLNQGGLRTVAPFLPSLILISTCRSLLCLMHYKGSFHFPPPCRKIFFFSEVLLVVPLPAGAIWADFPLFSSRITLKGRGSHQLRIYLWNSGGWGLDTRSSICIEHLNSLVEKVRKQAWPDKSLGKERLSLPNQGVFPRLAQSRESVPAPWGQRTDSEVGGSSKIWLLFRKTSFWMAQENIPKFNIGCRHSNHLWQSPRIMLPSTWDWDECGQKCLLYSHCPENPQGRERAISSVWTWSRRPQAHKGISVEHEGSFIQMET